MLPLLNAEWEEELAQAQEAHSSGGAEGKGRGAVVANLKCVGAEGGLLGRSLLTFVANKGDGANPIPPHKLSQNDMVDVRPSKGAAAGPPTASGVVYRITERTIVVAVDALPDEGLNVPLRLEKLANEVTHRRLKDTLTQLTQAAASGTASASPGAHLIDIVFGGAVPRFHEAPLEWEPIDRGLDDSQVKAVGRALAARDVALIHGPPGTGKTTAVVEVIKQEVARGRRVLACAASNIAVDNIVERVAAPAPGGASEGAPLVVRVGHPARLLPQVLSCSLEAHVLRSDNSALAQDCRREIREHSAALSKLEGWKRAERGKLQAELRRLAREERKRQEAAVEEVLRKADVVCCTLTGLHVRHMRNLVFDVCIVDEAAQALEVATWGALLRAPRAILAGDHLQLPPTVLSPQGEAGGLGCTLFERLIALYGESGVSEMLLTQYRMHADIMQWSSGALYENKLEAHPSVAAHKLEDIAPRAAADGGDEPFPALMLVDTAGCDMWEAEGEGGSWRNDGEVEVVLALLDRLDAAGVAASRVGVISPYSAQVGALREARGERYEGVEISTVDGFQGREKEAIIISAVRSNDRREVGFLSDKRRMNVAVTRARRHCCLICDSETLSSDAFLAQLVQHFEEHGTVSTAEEFAQGWS
ncbi:unnamed protein product [Pedinophyceae sp. YPF-701]|nr:unnamed protein product [Pedinophyceae sp. YPF-701]